MAAHATAKRFVVQLANVDAGVYAKLDIRLAQHPSESARFMLTRLIAYCFLSNEDTDSVLEFSKGGLSAPEEPALSRTSLDGRLLVWCEIGSPSFERTHKASKAAPRLVIVTHQKPQILIDELTKGHVHRKEEILALSLDGAFLDAFAAKLGERTSTFDLTITEGHLYVSIDGEQLEGELHRVDL